MLTCTRPVLTRRLVCAGIACLGARPATAQPSFDTHLLDTIPEAVIEKMIGNNKLVGSPGLAWKRRVLSVAFNGGTDALYGLIEKTAAEW